MRVFIDSEFRCHTTNQDGTFREVETDFFDGKCDIFIEGFCYDDSKGYVQIYSWKPFGELDATQWAYEREQLKSLSAQNAEYEAALSEIETALGVTE